MDRFPPTQIGDLLRRALQSGICVSEDARGPRAHVVLATLATGHHFPSGAAHNRRVWAEVIASRADESLLRSGVVDETEAIVDADSDTWLMRDTLYDVDGNATHRFWDAARAREQDP